MWSSMVEKWRYTHRQSHLHTDCFHSARAVQEALPIELRIYLSMINPEFRIYENPELGIYLFYWESS